LYPASGLNAVVIIGENQVPLCRLKLKNKKNIAFFNKKLAALTIIPLRLDGDYVRRFSQIKINMERRNEKG